MSIQATGGPSSNPSLTRGCLKSTADRRRRRPSSSSVRIRVVVATGVGWPGAAPTDGSGPPALPSPDLVPDLLPRDVVLAVRLAVAAVGLWRLPQVDRL